MFSFCVQFYQYLDCCSDKGKVKDELLVLTNKVRGFPVLTQMAGIYVSLERQKGTGLLLKQQRFILTLVLFFMVCYHTETHLVFIR